MAENEKIGFFEENVNEFSMTRLLSFLVSVVPLSVWAIANLIKFSAMVTSNTSIQLNEVVLVPIPESVLGLIVSGFTLKWAQKKFGENIDNIISNSNNESESK